MNTAVQHPEDVDEEKWPTAFSAFNPQIAERVETLAQAYERLRRRHQLVALRHQAMTAALDRLPLALLIIDNLKVTWTNDAAERLLSIGGPIAIEVQSIQIRDDTLGRAIEGVRTGRLRREALCISINDEPWHIVLLGGDLVGAPVLAAIAVGDGPTLRPHADDYEVLFGLTPREARVATLLLDGRTGREIAGVLDVGFETARSHVQHVLRKLGCPRQSAAVRPLASSPAAIGPTPFPESASGLVMTK